ncbi:YjbH domain-containing protein [Cobetia sp. L2A1]|uniref:YjbH domain-containing protein n=1 Tax=Cobetia sp. L2A1 TaxID=2686360 RepID=UPI001E452017|nr:YjbH domain-containing protein [Cobetia sp. L2A1]
MTAYSLSTAHDRVQTAIRQLVYLSAGMLLIPSAHAGLLDGEQPVESRLSGLGLGQSDFGGVGLMQTPTARMQRAGSLAFSYTDVSPYRRYNVSLQPLEWLETGFRYTEITNRLYGEAIAGDRDYLDKGVDAKIRLWEESRYLPAVAVGLRDMGGTSLFGSEYLVASKRWYDFDFTLGLGWGYLGSRGDLNNPLGWASDNYNDRPTDTGGDEGGEFSLNSLFKGQMGIFGGVEWQTPWQPLVLMAELDGNDYQSEPQSNDQEQDSPINLGARLSMTDNLILKAGWERGNTAMLGVTFGVDLAGLSQAKLDTPPEPLVAKAPASNQLSWPELSREIQAQSGIRVDSLTREGTALIVSGESTRFRSTAQAEGRANRVLHNRVDDYFESFHYRLRSGGLDTREDVHARADIAKAGHDARQQLRYTHSVYALAATEPNDSKAEGAARYSDEKVLLENTGDRWSAGFSPGLNQNIGGPDGYLYQGYLKGSAAWRTDRHGWLSGSAQLTLFDNFDQYEYISDSKLQRVRSYIGRYIEETDVGIDNLQYTRTHQFGRNWYGMAYGGILEMMYAGVGGEVLYRPLGSPLAYGVDVNWVKQRAFNQQFGLRDYSTTTGHASIYWDTGYEDVLAKISLGRYLAKDLGMTLDISRGFANGARMGAWASFTDAGDDFGEGSFDKGFYIMLPLDAFFVHSSRDNVSLAWNPLTRDGGARLNRKYSLYDMTDYRDMDEYWQDFDSNVWK